MFGVHLRKSNLQETFRGVHLPAIFLSFFQVITSLPMRYVDITTILTAQNYIQYYCNLLFFYRFIEFLVFFSMDNSSSFLVSKPLKTILSHCIKSSILLYPYCFFFSSNIRIRSTFYILFFITFLHRVLGLLKSIILLKFYSITNFINSF